MKLTLTPFHFRELIVKGYSLDHIVLLRMVHGGLDLKPMLDDSAKIASLYQTLLRKGLVTEESKLTTMGTELLLFMESKEPRKIVRKKVDDSVFSEWWKAFPGTDTFTHKGVTFNGARSLRINESACRLKFEEIVLEGDRSAEELIGGLKYDVHQKKEMSVKTGINKLTYLQNSLTYLNQRSYEPFIELIKQGVVLKDDEPQQFRGGTDI